MLSQIKSFPYYIEKYLNHYLDYHKQHPNLTVSDLMWQVNAGLYRDFYEEIEEIKDTNTFPLLVNKYHKLPSTFIPATLSTFPSSTFQACQNTIEAFLSLQAHARLQNLHLSILSAYRTYDYQQKLYEDYVKTDGIELADTYSARPGHSEHQTGYALDVCVTNEELEVFEGTRESNWLIEHAHEYGFIIRYPQGLTSITGYQYEPWHITYVGTKIAKFMKEHRIQTLEEYIAKFIP